jgi:ABC-2 type transport system ATP-binding protein
MGAVIATDGLTKLYGKQRGVLDLTLEVQQGEVFGYLGPNGAGKTTTIRTFLDFIRPTSGRATVFGMDTRAQSTTIHKRVGYVPGELSLYDGMTGGQYLHYMANLRGGIDWKTVDALAQRLSSDLSRPIRSLSHGNKRKIALIEAFMREPELIILDEPTGGLDPLMQREFYSLIAETKADGRTVFLSSHVLPEVERVCDRVGIIREGKLIAVENMAALKERALRRLEIHFAGPVPSDAFANVTGLRDVTVKGSVLYCTITGSLDAMIKTAAHFEVINVISQEPSLEEIFLTFYGGGTNGGGEGHAS